MIKTLLFTAVLAFSEMQKSHGLQMFTEEGRSVVDGGSRRSCPGSYDLCGELFADRLAVKFA